MDLNLLNVILLFGIVQGIILMIVFIRRSGQHVISGRLMSGIVLILSLATLGTFLGSSIDIQEFKPIHLLLIYFPFHLVMALGPLIYFYCQILFENEFDLRERRFVLHLFPVLLDILPFCISVYFSVAGANMDDINRLIQELNLYNTYVDIPRFISLSVYLYYSWRYLKSKKTGSDRNTFVWCRNLLIGMTLIVAIWLPYLLVYVSPWQDYLLRFVYYFPVYYPVVGIIYFISFQLMLKNISLRSNPISTSVLVAKAEELIGIIEHEQLYLNPDLRLNQLAARLHLPEKKLSFILNHHLKKGFQEFINEFRINEALRKLDGKAFQQSTLEGIALDVGFSSRATFYRAFKKVTGELPTEYINRLK